MILFGGGDSVYDKRLANYFKELVQTVQAFHAAQKPILGVCLGAQIIAQAFGAKIMRQGFLEYGFAPLHKENPANDDPLLKDISDNVTLFEMHGDTFCIPKSAIRLLRGDAVANQAFRVGKTTYGFQCHFEVTAEIVRAWTEYVWGERREECEMIIRHALASFAEHGEAQRSFATKVTNAWIDLVAKQAFTPCA
jgi:GMP synthase-like glutamine amidotransferase